MQQLHLARRPGSDSPPNRSPWEYTRLDDVELLALIAGERDQAAFSEFFIRKARPV
jgi:hypothetical protein